MIVGEGAERLGIRCYSIFKKKKKAVYVYREKAMW
jgi:hypothetical protein